MKFVWKLVDGGIRTLDYTTNSSENEVHGHLTLPYDWSMGTYRADVYINGALDKTIDYEISG